MGLIAKGTRQSEPIPAGLHQAVCFSVVDTGTRHNDAFDKDVHEVVLGFEIPSVRIKFERDGQEIEGPRVTSKTYTISLHDKAKLCQDLISWRGKAFTTAEKAGFDISKLVGVNCQLQMLHRESDGKTYANINSILPAAVGQKLKPESPTQLFSFEDHTELPDGVPEWLAEKVKASPEWQKIHGDVGDVQGGPDDYTGPTEVADGGDDPDSRLPF